VRKLRHPIRAIREPFGTAGLLVAIVALVAALGGGAYAATGSSAGAKATASAKGKQGPRGKTGKTGPAGPAGPVGPAGAPGAKGDPGAPGANGINGAAGASVTSAAVPTGVATCSGRGGSEFKAGAVVTTACNGKEGVAGADGAPGAPGPEGSPWTAGGTLPAGKTETGTFAVGPFGTGVTSGRAAISFTIPLAAGVGAIVQPLPESASQAEKDAAAAACPGGTENPIATPGFLCVYELNSFGLKLISVQNPETGEVGEGGKVGALLRYEEVEPAGFSRGVWAVTAP
jgi:Collagen triple helix repeat (20 copies)